MPQPYQPTHWRIFSGIPFATQGAVGEAPASWAARHGLLNVPQAHLLPAFQLDREALRQICRNPAEDVLFAYVCSMAWGGQGKTNEQSAWAQSQAIRPLLTALRQGMPDALSAYKLFIANKGNLIDGLGPSYFTKLIHFFSPHNDFHIVDNKVLEALQVLTGLPHRQRATPGGYLAALQEINAMAALLSVTAEEMEQRLFSGKGEPWRLHVLRQTLSNPGVKGYRAQMIAAYSTGANPIPPAEFW